MWTRPPIESVAALVARFDSVFVWIRDHEVPHHCIQIMASSNELAQRAASRAKRIKFLDRQAAFGVGTSEVCELPVQFVDDLGINRIVNATANLNVAGVEAHLPRIRR